MKMKKIPNHSLEIEQRVLENLMAIAINTDTRIQQSMLKLNADCFYNPCNAEIFAIIRNCFNKQESFGFVDILNLIPRGDDSLHNTLSWIIDNYRQLPMSDHNLESDIDKLLTLSIVRRQVRLAEQAVDQATECRDVYEAQNILVDKVTEISNLVYRQSKHGVSNTELAEAFYDGTLSNDLILPTTCNVLNQQLGGGVMSKSLITIAAGAGVGKTGFAIYLMDAIARNQPDKHSLFFSLEMEAKHIWMRHVGIRAGKQFDTLTKEERLSAISSCLELPVNIYDAASSRACNDIDFIVTTARLKAMEKPISVVVVDYLGLVQNKGLFERNDLKQSDITTKLANLALELNCVVIALSQINRSSASRAKDDQCPYPSDAADSSGSHRSSTLWLGVDRPELYQDDPCYRNQFVVKCRKNRFGGIFEFNLAFNEGTFAEVHEGYFRKPYAAKNKSPEEYLFQQE